MRRTETNPLLAARLNELFSKHRLSPAQRRIARYLVAAGAQAPFLNSSDIARAVNVSQPSVSRFAFALGFDGFPEFRERLRALAYSDQAPAEDPARTPLQQLVDFEAKALADLADSLADSDRLVQVADAMAGSRPLPIIGLRVSAPLATYLSVFSAKVLPDVRLHTTAGTSLYDDLARAAEAGATWVLAVGMPRYPMELRQALSWARECGLSVALISDSEIGPLTSEADIVLAAPVNSRFAFDSQAAPSVLCTALMHTLMDRLPETDQARLETFEQRAIRIGTFLEP